MCEIYFLALKLKRRFSKLKMFRSFGKTASNLRLKTRSRRGNTLNGKRKYIRSKNSNFHRWVQQNLIRLIVVIFLVELKSRNEAES